MSGVRPRPPLRIDTHPASGDGTTVVGSGAIDVVASQGLEGALCNALDRSSHGIEGDLSRAELRDSSGIDALANVHRHAHQSAKDLVGHTVSANDHSWARTAGQTAFAAPEQGDKTADTRRCTPGAASRLEARADSDHDDGRDLRTVITHLKRALQTRPVIDLARGALMACFGLSAEGAWTVLVEASHHTNTKLRYVAEELVNTIQGAEMPESFRQQVASAVTRLRPVADTDDGPALRTATNVIEGPLGSWRLPGGFGEGLADWSTAGVPAHAEAEYFDGVGEQHAAVWSDGAVVLGPLHVPEGQPFGSAASPISQALRRLGVAANAATEEFTTVGLDRYQHSKDWIAQSLSPSSPANPALRAVRLSALRDRPDRRRPLNTSATARSTAMANSTLARPRLSRGCGAG
ncbi:ANTAR domain-containing protein [Streptomyces umbrinus]|uniref:ANTAR domain-containing protein n=1 Tax=Streptomyces umbrinus TaxID=67370 RepID=UPI003C30E39A